MTQPDINEVQSFWEAWACEDPLYAILSDPARRGRQWTPEAFFETGRREISLLMYQLRRLGLPARFGRALDFGCGVGRLTQALAAHADAVVGIDVSRTMVSLAERLNAHPGVVRYVCNAAPNLAVMGSRSLDFIYSDIVLQHLEPELAAVYLNEFCRVLAPGGVLVFQLPSHRVERLPATAPDATLPDDWYRASIEESELPSALKPGESASVTVGITNTSRRDWIQDDAGTIRIGNHWLDAGGVSMLVQDDGRSALPAVVPSGTRIEVLLTVTAPDTPGQYTCEIDLVHEGVTWFRDRGGKSVRRSIAVGTSAPVVRAPADRPAPSMPSSAEFYANLPSSSASAGDFPMHGIHRDIVLRLLADAGLDVVHVEIDERCGKEWVGYRYFARRAS